MRYYILDADGNPVPEPDPRKWVEWRAMQDTLHVGSTMIGGVHVSTVFLAIDHAFMGKGKPVLWETMVFDGPHNGYQVRYTSRAAAEDGHKRTVFMVQEAQQ